MFKPFMLVALDLPMADAHRVPTQATWLSRWDVASPEECLLSNATWRLLTSTSNSAGAPLGARFTVRAGQILQQRDKPCRQFYVLIEVRTHAFLCAPICITTSNAVDALRNSQWSCHKTAALLVTCCAQLHCSPHLHHLHTHAAAAKPACLVQGQCEIERPADDNSASERVTIAQGSLVGCAAFLSSTRARATIRAARTCKIAAFSAAQMETVLVGLLSS